MVSTRNETVPRERGLIGMAIPSVMIQNTNRYVNDYAIQRGNQDVARRARVTDENLTHATLGNEKKAGSSVFQQSIKKVQNDGNQFVRKTMSQSTENLKFSDLGHLEKIGQSAFQQGNKRVASDGARAIATAMQEVAKVYEKANNYRAPQSGSKMDIAA